MQVYAQPFPATGAKYQVSVTGGYQPKWLADGKELFFLAPNNAMTAAAIDATNQFERSTPQMLFGIGNAPLTGRHAYSVSRDGQRFLINMPQERPNAGALNVVVNWLAAVQK